MTSLHGSALVLTLCSAVVGQQTLVVDPAGGGQFVTVSAALAAAAPGDTLFVRGGSYGGQHVVGAPLQLVGDPTLPRPLLSSILIVPGTGGGVSVVHADIGTATIQGGAALDQVRVSQLVVQAGSVALSRCDTFYYTVRVLGGEVAFHRCTLTGRPATAQQTHQCIVYPAEPALEVAGGSVVIAECIVTGGAGSQVCIPGIPGVASTAMIVSGGQVRATQSQFVGGQFLTGQYTPAVTVSGGAFEFDPSTQFVGSGTPPVATIFLPATDGQSAVAGSTITVTLRTAPGLAALLVASLGRGVAAPSFAGDVWFDAANYVVLAFGVTDGLGQLGAGIAVPVGVQRGTAITAQGGVISLAAVAVAATPVVVHVQ